jgi:hypothetical protein
MSTVPQNINDKGINSKGNNLAVRLVERKQQRNPNIIPLLHPSKQKLAKFFEKQWRNKRTVKGEFG